MSSDAATEAVPSAGDTAAPIELAAWAASKPASAAGSAGDRWVANICGERGASTHPFDPGTVFPLEVRYSTDGNSSIMRPFDPGKGCPRNARRGRAVLGVDLPFDRGKASRRIPHEG